MFPADGRHLGFQDAAETPSIYAKGQTFDLAALLGDAALAVRKYRHGAIVCSRLCPVDYHRFHFPVAGTPSAGRLINGFLYSVGPFALAPPEDRLPWQNKRKVVTLRTEKFGDVLLVPVGATMVGGIVETFTPGAPVEKSAEMGYFRFPAARSSSRFSSREKSVSLRTWSKPRAPASSCTRASARRSARPLPEAGLRF